MARMMRRNYSGGCSCLDCGGPDYKGRAAEEAEWRREWDGEARCIEVPDDTFAAMMEPPKSAPGLIAFLHRSPDLIARYRVD